MKKFTEDNSASKDHFPEHQVSRKHFPTLDDASNHPFDTSKFIEVLNYSNKNATDKKKRHQKSKEMLKNLGVNPNYIWNLFEFPLYVDCFSRHSAEQGVMMNISITCGHSNISIDIPCNIKAENLLYEGLFELAEKIKKSSKS